uniref:Mitochondrial inner membrane protease ATP23 n=1 Tax=Corethron hystrix TaxID=216773 RepID=A0A7S1FQY9_9STRA|mmetsp:Transcript_23839/g.54301  ORF Transcript_23839/g.54301 Transcript_23839/m.54301 type:complete len:201 (+) Transcript_23839:49-651(+)
MSAAPKPTTPCPDLEKCNSFLRRAVVRNVTVQFLLDNLTKLGCTPPAGFMQCQKCDDTMSGGFGVAEILSDGRKTIRPELVICSNHMKNENHVNKVLVHEMIHAIDLCRTKMDPFNNCVQHACTEIRAENLSGECSATEEVKNLQLPSSQFAGHQQKCVKRRAALSLRTNPACKGKENEAIEKAFHACYADTYPFDRHPH